ncbi:hypothetical protein AB0F72_32240 [Actinoplanes sp. NPDC023936]|uniref:hypothetical protein n=1 Tax=Actinoplanes sp. NPDC023936 TaxID=3154910 RepID=UPI0033FB0B0F
MAPEVLPMRPMTAGELLDAGAALLRQRAWPLLAAAAPLVAVEQLVLAGMRQRAGLSPPAFLPELGDLGGWWVVVAAGFGMEAAIIALLGGYAGVAAGSALIGTRARWWTRPWAVAATAVISGVTAALAAYCGFVPWLIVYGLIGMATPALTLARTRHPFGRSARLATRDGLRPALIRLLGYGTWFLVRFALGTGWVAVASQIGWAVSDDVVAWVVPIAWGLANTVAYPALACLDAAMLVETRIRSEGLDIEIGRERARGGDGSVALVDAA